MHILRLYNKNKQSEIQNKKYMEVADVCIHLYLLEESDIKNIPANDNIFREFIC